MSDPPVICSVCERPKPPIGRSVSIYTFESYCDPSRCSGYGLEPRPSEYWPGERDEHGDYFKEIRERAS